jgi:hypothetical protein
MRSVNCLPQNSTHFFRVPTMSSSLQNSFPTTSTSTAYITKQWLSDPLSYDTDHDDSFYDPVAQRLLQESNTTTTTTSGNDGAILRATFIVYGSFVLGMFIAFCYVRRKFPRAYQLRNWVTDIKVCQNIESLELCEFLLDC